MHKSKSQTQGAAVDFGTRPHGLSADPSQTDPESLGQAAPDSLADGFAVEGQAAFGGQTRSCADGAQAAMPERRQVLGGHTFNFTEEQRSAVAFALRNQIYEVEESDEATEPEVVEELHYLESAWEILRLEGEFR